VTYGFGFMIESLVAVLLLVTIGYCMTLNTRLKRLKADEQALKATIAELITATEIAERAVAGLKATAQECDQTLGERLRGAERSCADLERLVRSGDLVMKRLSRIVAAGDPSEADEPVAEAVAMLQAEPEIEPVAQVEAEPELESMPVAAPAAVPDARAVAAAAQAFAERARNRLNALAA
jgi:hypothetical protein